MKYISTNKIVHDLHFNNGKRYTCPECSKSRKKSNAKDLEYYKESNTAYCFHCGIQFSEYKPYDKKEYVIPKWKNKTNLTDKLVKYCEGRSIMQETLIEMKVYSDIEYMPQVQKEMNVICFPYFFDSECKNIKFRTGNKLFKLISGAELLFYNQDCLKEYSDIIITEGEFDCICFIQNGFKNCVSVPNGANKNLEYLDNYIGLFEQIKTIYLALDQDTKGIDLRDEFIRRLGADKCRIISFKECKDANEYLMKYGGLEFKDLLKNSKQAPIKGIIYLDNIQSDVRDYYKTGSQSGLIIESKEIDQFITWELGRLAIVTGIPGSGKSEFVDYLVTRLNLLHNWKAAYFTPENYPLKYHYSKMYEKYIGKQFNEKYSDEVEYDTAYEYVKDNIFWILNENYLSLDKILENTKYLIQTKGIKILVIDPYNKIEHQYKDSETQYISRFLDKLISFGKLNNILIFLIAHPKKMNKGEVPSLYDISGSANFYNKTDYGFTVHRLFNDENIMINEIQVHFQKIKFKNLGEQGISELKYNYINGRFEPKNESNKEWDNSNWLISDIKEKKDEWKDEPIPF